MRWTECLDQKIQEYLPDLKVESDVPMDKAVTVQETTSFFLFIIAQMETACTGRNQNLSQRSVLVCP